MNRETMIKKIIGETAEKLGFYYKGCERNGSVTDYTFKSRKESDYEIDQSIWIIIFDHYMEGWDIRLTLDSKKRVEGCNLIKSKFKEGFSGDCWYFKDEEELKEILYLFQNFLEENGQKIFHDNKLPEDEVRETNERHWRLYQEHETLNETYRKLYGMEDTKFTAKLIRRISDLLMEKKDANYGDVKELLLGMAAIYGDQLIRRRGGAWMWKDDSKSCIVKGMEMYSYCIMPLYTVEGYWKRKKDDYLYLLDDFRNYPTETVI